ncbi:MAG: hypothetical protein WAK33_16270 [Silvibacterium sp.]
MRFTIASVCVLAALVIPGPSPAQQTPNHQPTFTTFDAPGAYHGTYQAAIDEATAQGSDFVYTYINGGDLTAINAQGDIVGFFCFETTQCEQADNFEGSFLFSRGTYITLNFPSTVDAADPIGINALGEIVGSYLDASNFSQHGFLLWFGNLIQIDAPGASSAPFYGTIATAINAQGDILGQYYDDSGVGHDYVLRNGKFDDFVVPIPGSTSNTPNGISVQGDVVGNYLDSSGTMHGFLLRKGIAYTIDFPGATSTSAQGINSEGDVVGYYNLPLGNNSTFNTLGFLLRNDTFTTILPPNGSSTFLGVLVEATGINDSGKIVGWYYMAESAGSAGPQGFLLTQKNH